MNKKQGLKRKKKQICMQKYIIILITGDVLSKRNNDFFSRTVSNSPLMIRTKWFFKGIYYYLLLLLIYYVCWSMRCKYFGNKKRWIWRKCVVCTVCALELPCNINRDRMNMNINEKCILRLIDMINYCWMSK